MSSEFLVKIRKIIVILLVLFVSILNTWIAFETLPVHAAESWVLESNAGTHDVTVKYNDQWGNVCTYDHHLILSSDVFYAFVDIGEQYSPSNPDVKGHQYVLKYYDSVSKSILTYSDKANYSSYFPEYGSNIHSYVQTLHTYFDSNGDVHYKVTGSSSQFYPSTLITTVYEDKLVTGSATFSLPVFESQKAMENYCLTGDTSGLVDGGSIDNPDFEDTAYAFTGFTANNKMTATWTGTTERSYLKDQEVEEYVRVNYYFADKEAQDTIKQADAYPDEFATADKTLTIDVSGLKPDNENWFLRYIRITPCYRQAGLGAWGDFYHGEPSYVYFSQDGSIDRIDAPYIKGELSSDMERPVIVLHEAANGNPTESDYSYFEFNNAQSDYFFEMKGRWYTTNDFDLYRDKLVWKYKYSTLLKNNLSTWVSVSDNRSSVGRFQFDVLGKSSWDNLLSSYPVDDRNYIGGSYNLFNKITGYSDALETLKMLLKQPYSLFNGYEVYVRYFRYDENGGIQYSKWTHFYNNLADSDGSSGSRLDDLDNMYSENQSDKGLTDDELSDLENGGNSRNDLDAVPKNNYDYSSLENATMNFFDLLKNFGTMLGQFPSMVAAVFGFLPPWLIGLIAVAIGAVIFCRFIGR